MDKEFIKNRISTIRNQNNISARSLSLELGMSSEYINQVENGRLTPSLELIINFCDYFEITIGEFFNEEISYPQQYKSIIEELNKLTYNELTQIENLIKLLNSYKK